MEILSMNKRKIEDMGRIYIPAEQRRELGLKPGGIVKMVCYADRIEIWPVKAEA